MAGVGELLVWVVCRAEQRGLDYDRPSPEPRKPEACTTVDTQKLLTGFVTEDHLDTSKDAAEHVTERDEQSDIPDQVNIDVEQRPPRWGVKTLRNLGEVVYFCEPEGLRCKFKASLGYIAKA